MKSKKYDPVNRDEKEVEAVERLESLSTYDYELNTDHILALNSDLCMGYLSENIRAAYQQAYDEPNIPDCLQLPIKQKAAQVFVARNRELNKKIRQHYNVPSSLN